MNWISVKDRLPEVGMVKPARLSWLVTNKSGKVWIETMHPSWWNKQTVAGDFIKITHWMPLPSAPTKVKA